MSLEAFMNDSQSSAEKNMLVPYYIMMAYRYYECDDPIVSDNLFDSTAKTLLNNWEKITHFHKDFLNTDMLVAGTYSGSYPSRAISACYSVSNKIFEKRLKELLKA
jgi:NAD-dependent DNA ligase